MWIRKNKEKSKIKLKQNMHKCWSTCCSQAVIQKKKSFFYLMLDLEKKNLKNLRILTHSNPFSNHTMTLKIRLAVANHEMRTWTVEISKVNNTVMKKLIKFAFSKRRRFLTSVFRGQLFDYAWIEITSYEFLLLSCMESLEKSSFFENCENKNKHLKLT